MVDVYLGGLYLPNFKANDDEHRLKLSYCEAGELYALPLALATETSNQLILLGSAEDSFFVTELRHWVAHKPLIATTQLSQGQSCGDNLLFVARTLGLQAYYV
jgi:hypothetical protein